MLMQINILVNTIINTYFNDSRCMIIYKNKEDNLEYNSIAPKIVFDESNDDKIEQTFETQCQTFIINTNDAKTLFEQLEERMKYQKSKKYNLRQYLIISTKHNDNAIDIFNSTSINYVADILVVKQRQKYYVNISKFNFKIGKVMHYVFDFYTHQYTTRDDSNKVLLLDTWYSQNQSFQFNNNLYYDKISNQIGRPLKIATFTYKPYSIPNEIPEKSDGTEMNVALQYAIKHNMSVELVLDEKGEWGDLFENWTGSGIVGNLVYDNADVGLGALYTWERESNFFDLSTAVVRTGITILVPAPTLASGFLVPFLSFSIPMWIIVLVSFCVAVVAIAISNIFTMKCTKNKMRVTKMGYMQKSFMLVCSVFLQQSVPYFEIPKNKFAKSVFAGICILTVLISSCYSSGLASSMTIPRFFGAIKTAEDLAASQLYWGATSDAWINSIVKDTNPTTKAIVDKFIIANETELLKLGKGRFGFSVERLPGGYFAIGNYIEYENVIKNLRLLIEDLYWENCVLMLRKSSVLLPSLNKLILEIIQVGLMRPWEFMAVSRHLDNRLQTALRYSLHHQEKQKDFQKLSLRNVEGAFLVLLIGNLTATIIFICEITHGKKQIPY